MITRTEYEDDRISVRCPSPECDCDECQSERETIHEQDCDCFDCDYQRKLDELERRFPTSSDEAWDQRDCSPVFSMASAMVRTQAESYRKGWM